MANKYQCVQECKVLEPLVCEKNKLMPNNYVENHSKVAANWMTDIFYMN